MAVEAVRPRLRSTPALRQHADLHRADGEIGEHRVDLRRDEVRRHVVDAGDALVFCAVSAVMTDAP